MVDVHVCFICQARHLQIQNPECLAGGLEPNTLPGGGQCGELLSWDDGSEDDGDYTPTAFKPGSGSEDVAEEHAALPGDEGLECSDNSVAGALMFHHELV
jgi:hypothetical protein